MNELIKLTQQTLDNGQKVKMNISLSDELLKTDILTRVYNNTEFQFTLDGYVNVSPVSKAFGKRPNDYLRLGRTAEYIAALTNRFAAAGNPVTEENLVVCVTGGTPDKQGTWLHPKLVIDFARWVNPEFALWCDEQIENILKQSKLQFTMPTTLLEAGRLWLAELEAHEETKGLLSEAKQIIHENKPKVTYYDLVLQSEDLMNISQIAKDFEITAQKLNKILPCIGKSGRSVLHEEGVQYKDKSGVWLLYAEHLDKNYAQTVTNAYEANGKTHTKLHLKWTQTGRLFIYELLKSKGILPVVEKEVK